MKRLQDRKVYETAKRTYFGWDLRESERKEIHWQRSPTLSSQVIQHWPYSFGPEQKGKDMAPDFCVVVQGDPSDELLTSWLEEEEKGAELSCVA